MAAKFSYELEKLLPKVSAGYSGNPLDPLDVKINKALGSFGAIPPYFIPKKEDIITSVIDPEEILRGYQKTKVVYSLMPIRLKREKDTEWFTLPIEPLVTIRGKNVIIRRSVAKSTHKGTVKERWSQDDYEVIIQGVVTGEEEDLFPEEYINTLSHFFNERGAIEVDHEILLLLGIEYLAIESISFPHTKGINNQNFEIKAYSDYPIELLIKT